LADGATANQRRPRLTSGAPRRGSHRRRSPRRATHNFYVTPIYRGHLSIVDTAVRGKREQPNLDGIARCNGSLQLAVKCAQFLKELCNFFWKKVNFTIFSFLILDSFFAFEFHTSDTLSQM